MVLKPARFAPARRRAVGTALTGLRQSGAKVAVLGAEVAHRLCPRFGLDEKETDLVAWLVLQHLLMSRTAQKRDLTDPKTIEDFAGEVLVV